jgi:hypothetical protein
MLDQEVIHDLTSRTENEIVLTGAPNVDPRPLTGEGRQRSHEEHEDKDKIEMSEAFVLFIVSKTQSRILVR